MSVQWLSINDVRRLIKQRLYRMETGAKPGDLLICDNRRREYVGHIEGNSNFEQAPSYSPPRYIIEALETFDGGNWNAEGMEWSKHGHSW